MPQKGNATIVGKIFLEIRYRNKTMYKIYGYNGSTEKIIWGHVASVELHFCNICLYWILSFLQRTITGVLRFLKYRTCFWLMYKAR